MSVQHNTRWGFLDITAFFKGSTSDTNDNLTAYKNSMHKQREIIEPITCLCGCKDFNIKKYKTLANFFCLSCGNKITIRKTQWHNFCVSKVPDE